MTTLTLTVDNQIPFPASPWLDPCKALMLDHMQSDPAHCPQHFERVLKNAYIICKDLPIDQWPNPEVMAASVYLHDLVNYPKDHSLRSQAAEHSAKKAGQLLRDIDFPTHLILEVEHVISSHSLSGSQQPKSMCAKVVCDADACDSTGQVEVLRATATATLIGNDLYCEDDPLCSARAREPQKYLLDHILDRQEKLRPRLQTEPGRRLFEKGHRELQFFLKALERQLL